MKKIEKMQVIALFIEKNMKMSFKCEKTKIPMLQNFRFWSTRLARASIYMISLKEKI